MAPGSGSIRHGEGGKGIGSRWYPKTICKRIAAIGEVKDRITFVHGDGLAVLREYTDNPGAVFFIDPPYTASTKRAGRRLYTYNEIDHALLFELAGKLVGDFLMTYDNCPEICHMAMQHGFDIEPVAMKSTHHATMTELLVAKDLSWLRS